MNLDAERCYRAILSRDHRFDGRFFTGVRTTKIYCRPVCPARTPRLENVRFFSCPAAAEEAGYRPCRRCRPETAPGTPAWSGTSATVARALRLIHEGAMDDAGVDSIAERLGMGSRHLRRLFIEHIGASPISVAKTRRVHFARRLIDETDLPVSEVAFASGFRSIRRFNAAVLAAFGESPRALRFRRSEPPRPDGLTLRLAYRPPYDWDSILGFLEHRALPGIEEVADGAYRRAILAGGVPGVIEVRKAARGPALLLSPGNGMSPHLMTLVDRVRRVFDLDCDPLPIAAHLRKDPLLAEAIARRPGLRVPGAWDPFEISVRAVIGQQVSVAGARTVAGRLARRWGAPLPRPAGSLTHVFPTPAVLAGADLSQAGIPRARAAALRTLAVRFRDDPDLFSGARELEEVVERLCEIPGIGPWTAGYIAMRGLGEPDAMPSGDLGVGRGLALKKRRDIEERAERWRPWRAYATIHLWANL
jgi:AraC family transcriptional regulator, regulatory protein of adaptative response / DNA-3-methyladenine glycosylase II